MGAPRISTSLMRQCRQRTGKTGLALTLSLFLSLSLSLYLSPPLVLMCLFASVTGLRTALSAATTSGLTKEVLKHNEDCWIAVKDVDLMLLSWGCVYVYYVRWFPYACKLS